FFHLGLTALAWGAAQLTVALFHAYKTGGASFRLRARHAWVAAALVAASGAAAQVGLQHARALRSITLERTAVAARLLRVTAVGHRPRAQASTEQVAAHPQLPLGPHLEGQDVFLITIDAMRADRLTPRTAPHLSKLASNGAVFDRAYAQVPHTSF